MITIRKTVLTALFGAAALAGCQKGGFDAAQSAPLGTDDEKASYAIGIQIGTSLEPAGDHVQMGSFLRGIQDAIAGKDPAIPQDTLQAVLQRFTMMMQQEEQAKMAESADKNQKEGAAFLATNGAKPGITTTESGLQYEVMRPADGPKPTASDMVTIQYRGKLIDGTEFDSSYGRGEPTSFTVGGVIQGFSEALQLMPVGSQYRFFIPGELGYGAQGNGRQIGPNATLIFEVEMLKIGQ
jgi:FKBP-type peptidyl-prolyl cis-trans isomerase